MTADVVKSCMRIVKFKILRNWPACCGRLSAHGSRNAQSKKSISAPSSHLNAQTRSPWASHGGAFLFLRRRLTRSLAVVAGGQDSLGLRSQQVLEGARSGRSQAESPQYSNSSLNRVPAYRRGAALRLVAALNSLAEFRGTYRPGGTPAHRCFERARRTRGIDLRRRGEHQHGRAGSLYGFDRRPNILGDEIRSADRVERQLAVG